MQFGILLQKLLHVNNIKLGQLADHLGYDLSYVSKWINGVKMPSLRNNGALIKNIAQFFAANANPKGMDAMTALFFNGEPPADIPELETALSDVLLSAYLSDRPEDLGKKWAYNCYFKRKSCSDDSLVFLSEGIARAGRAQGDQQLEIITMAPLSLNGNTPVLFSAITGHKPEGRPLRIRQTLHMKSMQEHLDVYCRCICSFMWCPHNIIYEFYETGSDVDCNNYMFIIKDGLLIFYLTDPFGKTVINLLTSDRELVSAYYDIAGQYLYGQHPLITRVDPKSLYNHNLTMGFILAQRGRYLLRDMQPIFMSSAMLNRLANRYVTESESKAAYLRLYGISFPLPKQVIVFKSVIIDYLLNGSLHIFGKTLLLSQEDRAAHLGYIIECFRQISESELIILDDENPILSYHDTQVSLFLSNQATFAIKENPQGVDAVFHFRSKELIDCFNLFFDHLYQIPGNYRICGDAALLFLEQIIKNM